MSNGSFTYKWLGTVSPSSQFKKNTFRFTVPANVTAVSIFHVIQSVGNLTVDEYSLQEVGATTTPPLPPPPPPPTPTTTPSTNIIPNGDIEIVNPDGTPLLWVKDRWNNESAIFSYPVTGVNGSKAVKTTITTQTSGDAKWIPEQVNVTPGTTYIYTDEYISPITSNFLLKYQPPNNGPYAFFYIRSLPASPNGFSTATFEFTVPSGMEKVTIYHYINTVGSLTLDNAKLVKKN